MFPHFKKTIRILPYKYCLFIILSSNHNVYFLGTKAFLDLRKSNLETEIEKKFNYIAYEPNRIELSFEDSRAEPL